MPEIIDESCCGTAATPVRATARVRTTTLVLASMMLVSVSAEWEWGGRTWMKEGRGQTCRSEARCTQSSHSGARYLYVPTDA